MEMLAEEENVGGLVGLGRAMIGKAEATDSCFRAIVDSDSIEIVVYGEQAHSAYFGQLERKCNHTL